LLSTTEQTVLQGNQTRWRVQQPDSRGGTPPGQKIMIPLGIPFDLGECWGRSLCGS